MARKPTLNTIYRKNKIVLTFRGRKVFEARMDRHDPFGAIKAFKAGWYGERA